MPVIRNVVRWIFPLLAVILVLIMTFYLQFSPREMPEHSKNVNKKPAPSKIMDIEIIQPLKAQPQSTKPPKVRRNPSVSTPPKAHRRVSDFKSGTYQGNRAKEPVIIAEYGLPFEDYLNYMLRLGALIAVYDVEKNDFACGLSARGEIVPLPSIAGYSRRARRLTADFPTSNRILRKVVDRFGPGDYEILLLLPSDLDQTIYDEIGKAAGKLGLTLGDLLSVKIRYEYSPQGLAIYIKTMETLEGKVYRLSCWFAL